MFAKFYKMSTFANDQWSNFRDDWLFATDKIVSYEYTKRLTKVGHFSMTLPFDKAIFDKLMLKGTAHYDGKPKLNGTILYDNDWLWIQSIQYDGRTITLSGTDAKGILDTRISLYGDPQVPGGEGYDIAAGTTKDCIRHYLINNAVSPSNVSRVLPIVPTVDGADGLQDDSYMARLEVLSDIVGNLCDNAGIGYDVRGKLASGCFQVQTVAGTDRSHEQNERQRVIFAVSNRNVRSMQCEQGVTDLYNEIYAVDSNDVVVPVSRGAASVGLMRRECTVNVGVSSTGDDEPYFPSYVIREVADNVITDSITLDPAVSSGYGTAYNIGDDVSVRDDFTGQMRKVRITEVSKQYSSGQQNITLTFGIPPQKPLQRIVNSVVSGTARRR